MAAMRLNAPRSATPTRSLENGAAAFTRGSRATSRDRPAHRAPPLAPKDAPLAERGSEAWPLPWDAADFSSVDVGLLDADCLPDPPLGPATPEAKSCSPRPLEELLARHLAAAQRALTASHEQAVGLVSKRVDSAWSATAVEAARLRRENSLLRAAIASSCNALPGTAEAPAGPTLQAAGPPGIHMVTTPSVESVESSNTLVLSAHPTKQASVPYLSDDGLASDAAMAWKPISPSARHQAGAHCPGDGTAALTPLSRKAASPPHQAAWRGASPSGSPSFAARRGTSPSGSPSFDGSSDPGPPEDRVRRMSINSQGMFPDEELMKDRIRKSIARPVYDVTNYYHTKGPWQRLARSYVFDYVSLVIIGFNAIWIGVDADNNRSVLGEPTLPLYLVMEHLFCFFFAVEWLVRFMAFKKKAWALRDKWFVFDSFLVALSVLESWVLRVVLALAWTTSSVSETRQGEHSEALSDASVLQLVRLLRLSRMMRMARLFRAIPELMIMMKGLLAAVRSVMVTLFMLTVILYIFGVAFTELMTGTQVESLYFGGVAHSMNTLLLHGVFLEDIPEVFNRIGKESVFYAAITLLFVLIASFLVVPMLIGVMVETVRCVSSVERERLLVNFTKDKLLKMLRTTNIHKNGDAMISKDEFRALLAIPEAVQALQELGVDVVGLVDLSAYVFNESDEALEFPNFMEMVLALRGSNKATVKDIVDLRKCMLKELRRIHRPLESMGGHLSQRASAIST